MWIIAGGITIISIVFLVELFLVQAGYQFWLQIKQMTQLLRDSSIGSTIQTNENTIDIEDIMEEFTDE